MWGFKKEAVIEKKEPEYAVELPEIKVNITPEAYKKMFGYVHAVEGEISGMGLVRQDNDEEFTIYDVFILKQEAGRGYTALDPKAIAKKVFELYKEGKYQDLSVWWHSHADFDTFWSVIDTSTCDRLANNKFLISLVVNKAGDVRARVDLYKPLRITVDDVMVKMPDHKVAVSEDMKKEVADLVTPVVFKQSIWDGGEFEVREQYLDDPYLFKGTRISRKRETAFETGGWVRDRTSDSEEKLFSFLHKKSKFKKADRKKNSKLEHVLVESGSYKTARYLRAGDCYVDEQYQPLTRAETGYVISESKHTVVVSMKSGVLLRVPKGKFEVIAYV